MEAYSPMETSASQLLAAAIADPFVWNLDESDAVRPWFEYAVAEFPLWTLQADAYLVLQPGDLPSTYPVGRLIESILQDEGITRQQRHGSVILDPLPATLDRRRHALCRQDSIWSRRRE